MKNLTLFLLATVAVSMFSPAHAQTTTQSKRIFWQSHKSKIKKGIALAALVGATIGLVYHGNKTKQAVEAAKINPNNAEAYAAAITVVGVLGPVGPDRAIKFFKWAKATNDPINPNQKILTVNDIANLAQHKVFNALAYYYYPNSQSDRTSFLGALFTVLGIQTARGTAQEVAGQVQAAAKKIENGVKSLFGK